MYKMKKIVLMLLFTVTGIQGALRARAQFPYGDKWYQNPLGFKPLSLHTGMGFIVPALITGTALIIAKKDSSLQNRLSIYSEMGITLGYKYPYTTVIQNNTGVNLMMRKWLSIGAEFSTTLPLDDYNSTIGFSIRPFARFYAVNKPGWQLWFESGGGLICFTDNFPKPTVEDGRMGTPFNGTTKYGIGASVRLYDKVHLLLGARHLHISNGNSKGVDRNPSHDSNGAFAGITWGL
jgi:hypothetical protein